MAWGKTGIAKGSNFAGTNRQTRFYYIIIIIASSNCEIIEKKNECLYFKLVPRDDSYLDHSL